MSRADGLSASASSSPAGAVRSPRLVAGLPAWGDGGMTVSVGRIRPCPVLDLRLVVLGHNTIRGAAGQGIQIAELLVAEDRIKG